MTYISYIRYILYIRQKNIMPKKLVKASAGRPSNRTGTKAAINMADDPKNVRLNFLVPEATRDKVKAYCFENRVTISDLFRSYIETLPN